jgi:hypothetical protein
LLDRDFAGQLGDETRPAIAHTIDTATHGILLEAYELCQLGLVRRSDGEPVNRYADVRPAAMRLEGLGRVIVELALERLDDSSINDLIAALDRGRFTH